MLRLSTSAVFALAALAGTYGCGFEGLDLTGKACPCAEGFVCTPANVCARVTAELGGELDGPLPEVVISGAAPGTQDGGAPSVPAGPDGSVGSPPPEGVDAGAPPPIPPDPPPPGPAPPPPTPEPDPPPAPPPPPPPMPTDSSCDEELTGTLFCDGFEGNLAAWDVLDVRGGEARTVTNPVLRGDTSMRVRTSTGSGVAGVTHHASSLVGVSSGSMHVRVFLYMPSSNRYSNWSAVVQLTEGAPPYGALNLAVTQGNRLTLQVKADGANETLISSAQAIPEDRWFCLQIDVDIANSGGAAEVRVDGDRYLQRSGLDTEPDRGFFYINTGWGYTASNQTPLTMYVDEFAIDRSPIPCNP